MNHDTTTPVWELAAHNKKAYQHIVLRTDTVTPWQEHEAKISWWLVRQKTLRGSSGEEWRFCWATVRSPCWTLHGEDMEKTVFSWRGGLRMTCFLGPLGMTCWFLRPQLELPWLVFEISWKFSIPGLRMSNPPVAVLLLNGTTMPFDGILYQPCS